MPYIIVGILLGFRNWPAILDLWSSNIDPLPVCLFSAAAVSFAFRRNHLAAILFVTAAMFKIWVIGAMLCLLADRDWRPFLTAFVAGVAALFAQFVHVGFSNFTPMIHRIREYSYQPAMRPISVWGALGFGTDDPSNPALQLSNSLRITFALVILLLAFTILGYQLYSLRECGAISRFNAAASALICVLLASSMSHISYLTYLIPAATVALVLLVADLSRRHWLPLLAILAFWLLVAQPQTAILFSRLLRGPATQLCGAAALLLLLVALMHSARNRSTGQPQT